MENNEKIILKEYLDIFYVSIYRIRLLIKIHSLISNYSNRILNQQWWGFIQNNLSVSAVIVEIFSVIDATKSSLIKKMEKLLKKHKVDFITIKEINNWINKIKKYQVLRHKVFAHKDYTCLQPTTVMYEEILAVIDDFDEKLKLIDINFLNDVRSPMEAKIVSKPSEDISLLIELENILLNENWKPKEA